jgi:4-hydroxy-tetrahydrodipicolinate reductase
MIRVAIPGCVGRMGKALVQAIAAAEDLQLTGASAAPGAQVVGMDAGTLAGISPLGVVVTDDPLLMLGTCDGVIDFTAPSATVELALLCQERGVPLVIGSTGWTEEQRRTIARVTEHIPVVMSPNMSVGVNVLFRLVTEATRLLGPSFELEIIEAHHNQKADAPSGTALRLAQTATDAASDLGSFVERACFGRHGISGPRPRPQIGIHSIRGGDIVGEHTVMFCSSGERVEIAHKASNRQTFANGALRALRWLCHRPAGLYDMEHVLGLK